MAGLAAELAMASCVPSAINTSLIQTKSLFSFMDLPAELRLKVYPHLLISPEVIVIRKHRNAKALHVSILQACKTVNDEATSILYAKNIFVDYISTQPCPAYDLKKDFFLSSLRWPTIRSITSIMFKSDEQRPRFCYNRRARRAKFMEDPTFTCTGQDIIDRITSHSSTYYLQFAKSGPDEVMLLSLSNWISIEITKETLRLFSERINTLVNPDVPHQLVTATAPAPAHEITNQLSAQDS